MGRRLAGVVWCVGVVAALVVLLELGSGALAAPPLTSAPELRAWTDERGAVTVALALVRLLGLGLTVYLLAVTALALAARLTRAAPLVRLAEITALPTARRLLGTCAGISFSASVASMVGAHVLPVPPAAVGTPASDGHDGVVLWRLPDEGDIEMRRLPELVDDTDGEGTSTMRVEEREPPTTSAPGWIAAPGDHLWHIAEATLTTAWGRVPSDAEIAPYWNHVVEINRPSLPDPANPDLIYPGQVVVLPPPPLP